MELGGGRLGQLPLRWRWPEEKEMRSGGGGGGRLGQLPLRWRWPEDKEMLSGGGGSDV